MNLRSNAFGAMKYSSRECKTPLYYLAIVEPKASRICFFVPHQAKVMVIGLDCADPDRLFAGWRGQPETHATVTKRINPR